MPNITLSGTRLQEIRTGLHILRQKRLPTPETDMLVASLWCLAKPAFDEYDLVSEKLERERSDIAELEEESEERKERTKAWRKAMEALADRKYEIAEPKSKLSSTNLPKQYKGEAGMMNPAGNALVITALSPEFYADPEAAEAPEKEES